MHFFTDKKPPSGGFFLCTAKQGSRETDDLSPGSSPPVARGLYLAPPTLFHGSTLKSGFQENWRFLNGILMEHSQMYPPRPGAHLPKPPSGRLWRDLIIAHSTSAPTPTLAPYQRQRRKRYKQSPEPTTLPTALYSRVCATEFVRSIARQGILRP